MINVGICGIGFMGWIHWLAYKKVSGVQVTAISTRSEKKLTGDWRDIQGNFGPPGEQVDLSGVAVYPQLEELLADETVDVIDVCLPPYRHTDAAIAAAQAGKHVFVEKPLSLTTAGCDEMVEAAEAAGKQVLAGHVLPFFPEYACARRIIDSGEYGRLLGGHFKRIVSDPQWMPDFFDPNRGGGPLVDLHVHDAHLIRMLLGMPRAVTAEGRLRDDVVEWCTSLFHYEDPSLAVSATSGVINQQGRPFTHGFEMHLEAATLQYEAASYADGTSDLMPLKILSSDGEVTRPELGEGDPLVAFEAEIQDMVQSITSGTPSSILSGALARDAIALCHKQTESVRSGTTVML